ncbi:MAG: hypothetical protein KDN20_00285 [Verrucomicrobiae bacterium]|nr:hypothetical protein [Verrucomicrobiae bacterium]
MRTPARYRRKVSAFSLLEVILALGVFAVAGVSLMVALNDIAKASTESVDEARVTSQLRTLLTYYSRQPRIEPFEKIDSPSRLMGFPDELPDSSGIAYRVLVEPAEFTTAKGEKLNDMFRIEITALRKLPGSGEEVIEKAETLRYGQFNLGR